MVLLKATPNARVAIQSSGMHKKTSLQKFDGDIHFDDINFDKDFDTNKAYVQSKLANLLFPYELDRQFKQHGIQAVSTAAHPGYTATNLQANLGLLGKITNLFIAQKVEMGAWPILRKATDPALRGGEYLGLCSLTKDHMMWILPNGSGHYLNLQLSSRIISRSWLTANHLSNQFHFRMHRFMGVPRPMHPLISVMELDTVKISV